ncbi:hypothetical protein ACLB2K_015281 [Fragaria x ananassa]
MGVTVILPQFLHLQPSTPNQKAVKTSCLLSYGGRRGEGGVLLRQNNQPNTTTIKSSDTTTLRSMKLNSSSSSSSRTAAKAAGAGAAAAADDVVLELELGEIKDKYMQWNWKGKYAINYVVSHPENADPNPNAPPVLLVHGFGASIPHWRRNIKTLAKNYTVYAIDLIGFGASDKPIGFSYTMEKWAEKPTVLIGNSVGSLACVISASESKQGLQLIPGLSLPILVLWGDEDPLTPLDGPVGKYFSSLPSQQSNVSLSVLQGVGHCPHDDRAKLVHDRLLPWLANLST